MNLLFLESNTAPKTTTRTNVRPDKERLIAKVFCSCLIPRLSCWGRGILGRRDKSSSFALPSILKLQANT
ncbi:hypothetical protein GQ457_02G039480 [Hibiscus cannabinus]